MQSSFAQCGWAMLLVAWQALRGWPKYLAWTRVVHSLYSAQALCFRGWRSPPGGSAADSLYSTPLCSSTRALVGHTLGAAGAIEAGFCWLTLRNAGSSTMDLIPHVFDGVADPDIYSPPLVTHGMRVPVGPIMTNSFGFGGNNCSLILDRDVP